MIPVKVQCPCGQKFAFEVQPVQGRMPTAVACPACGADGTAVANAAIAQALQAQPAVAPTATVLAAQRIAAPAPPPPAARPAPMPIAAAPAPAPPPPAPAPLPRMAASAHPQQEGGPGGEGDTWKWWYYVLAGVCFAGYDIWLAYDKQSMKPLGGLFLAVLLVAIGIWDFQRKRKRRMG